MISGISIDAGFEVTIALRGKGLAVGYSSLVVGLSVGSWQGLGVALGGGGGLGSSGGSGWGVLGIAGSELVGPSLGTVGSLSAAVGDGLAILSSVDS